MQNLIQSLSAVIMAALTFIGIVSSPYDEPIDKINGGDPCIIEDDNSCYYTFTTGGGMDHFDFCGISDFPTTMEDFYFKLVDMGNGNSLS